MARKNIVNSYPLFNAQSMGADATSVSTNVALTDNIGMLIDWSGTSPVGTLVVEVCSDDLQGRADGLWRALDFGATINITGNTGQHSITINQLPYSWIRARYVRTSGTGSLTLKITTKQIGG